MKIDKLYEKMEQAEKELYKIHTTHNETEEESAELAKEIDRREKEIDKLRDNLLKIDKQLYDELDTHGENEELYDKFNNLQEKIDKLDKELDEVGVSDKEKEIVKKISRLYEEIDEVIGKEITEIEEELEQIDDDEEKSDALVSRLQNLDPYNDMFHLACHNWPNCESEGCGEAKNEV